MMTVIKLKMIAAFIKSFETKGGLRIDRLWWVLFGMAWHESHPSFAKHFPMKLNKEEKRESEIKTLIE